MLTSQKNEYLDHVHSVCTNLFCTFSDHFCDFINTEMEFGTVESLYLQTDFYVDMLPKKLLYKHVDLQEFRNQLCALKRSIKSSKMSFPQARMVWELMVGNQLSFVQKEAKEIYYAAILDKI